MANKEKLDLKRGNKSRWLDIARDSHASTYLTLISIVQGVAFSYLVLYVITYHNCFKDISWILLASTFLIIVLTWNEYIMGIVSFVWIPGILDALIPFTLGSTEIYIIYSISELPTYWFKAMAIFAMVSLVGFFNMYCKAREEDLNKEAIFAYGNMICISIAYTAFIALTSVILWQVCINYQLSHRVHLCFSLLSLIILIGFGVRTWFYWERFKKNMSKNH